MDKGLSPDKKEQIIRLRKIREQLNLTQEQFADYMGISVSALKKIESYERPISLNCIENLYKNLNVSTDYILFGKKTVSDDLWRQVLNSKEKDKMIIFLKLFHYFTNNKTSIFPTKDEELKHLNEIFEFIQKIEVSDNENGL